MAIDLWLVIDKPNRYSSLELISNSVRLYAFDVNILQWQRSYVFTDGQAKPIDQAELGRAFQAVLRVLKIRPRPFYHTRHTFISIALTVGCNQKWIAEQTGTSIAMIQEHYGKYIRDDGDALLRAYVEGKEPEFTDEKTGTFAGTFLGESSKYRESLVVPTGLEQKPAKKRDK